MRIGVPREIKTQEFRVGLVPAGVRELTAVGHEVWVETQAGTGIGISDLQYQAAGAHIAATATDLFAQAELIVKVKEPQPEECRRLHAGQALFTYLHLAADPAQARALMASGVTAIAYETVTATDGSLPLLVPMSEVAGRMSLQVAANCLQKNNGGVGMLLGGVAGVPAAKVLVLGGGVAGTNAIEMAIGLRADVTVVDRSLKRLRELSALFGSQLKTAYSTGEAIAQLAPQADVIIGSVLVPGAAAPRLITRAMLRTLKSGALLVDIAIDQGGCFETSHPTTHADPTFFVDGIQHYCVANMPGAVPRTSTLALTNATLPFVRELADRGVDAALAENPHLAAGVNVRGGRIVHPAVLKALGSDGRGERAA
jgi:alanine dehydrogenase